MGKANHKIGLSKVEKDRLQVHRKSVAIDMPKRNLLMSHSPRWECRMDHQDMAVKECQAYIAAENRYFD